MATPTPEATFHLFPKLPAETQLQIWEYTAVPYPREVIITMCTTIKKDEDDEEHKEAYFKSITPAPGILQACHDSRVQALKHYTTKAFQVKNRKGGELEESVYINRDLDILRINIPFKDVHRYVQWDFEDRVEGWRAGRREKNQYNNIDHRLVGYKYGVMCGKVGGMSFVLEKRVTDDTQMYERKLPSWGRFLKDIMAAVEGEY